MNKESRGSEPDPRVVLQIDVSVAAADEVEVDDVGAKMFSVCLTGLAGLDPELQKAEVGVLDCELGRLVPSRVEAVLK